VRDSEKPPELDLGTPGASAAREHARRRANRERRVRERHPRIGPALLALREEPHHERAWARGAGGEKRVAEGLAAGLDKRAIVLHDRRLAGSRANIDHIAIAASGVWVIDSKRYSGKVTISRRVFEEAKLIIAGRDRSGLVDGLARQVALVEAALRTIGQGTPLHGAICFVDAELPLFRTLSFSGFPLLYPRALAKRINQAGPLSDQRVAAVAAELSRLFPRA
jgi:hypothetical protein